MLVFVVVVLVVELVGFAVELVVFVTVDVELLVLASVVVVA